jgi:molybdopterin-guanine dinucleotide biosynthesis protein A
MGGLDKGLEIYLGRPLITHVLDVMRPVVSDILISANRHLGDYQRLGYRVVEDLHAEFEGPLAGLLSAMEASKGRSMLSAPCDTPRLSEEAFIRLMAVYQTGQYDLVMAHDGERLQPLVMVVGTHLKKSLADYLHEGGRRVDAWAHRHALGIEDFSDCPEIFFNINTIAELNGSSGSRSR